MIDSRPCRAREFLPTLSGLRFGPVEWPLGHTSGAPPIPHLSKKGDLTHYYNKEASVEEKKGR